MAYGFLELDRWYTFNNNLGCFPIRNCRLNFYICSQFAHNSSSDKIIFIAADSLQVHSDFVAAATRGAVAVIDGNVMAINPGEEPKMQMFIWNNIFFSLGFDVRDHYKELGGDAAAFVAPRNDLQGVRVYAAVDLPGLYTLGTVVIDYRCVPTSNFDIFIMINKK